ncbi:MAG: hypothetical protein JWM11_2800, partial [Planctomycetaceae bacterium]|nr:hypothetical protein [Planctomycetaceae bacterium]
MKTWDKIELSGSLVLLLGTIAQMPLLFQGIIIAVIMAMASIVGVTLLFAWHCENHS